MMEKTIILKTTMIGAVRYSHGCRCQSLTREKVRRMDKPKLKSCPFCGGEAEITEVIDRTPRNLEAVGFGVKCDQCGIIVAKVDCGVTDWFETDEEAAEA